MSPFHDHDTFTGTSNPFEVKVYYRPRPRDKGISNEIFFLNWPPITCYLDVVGNNHTTQYSG